MTKPVMCALCKWRPPRTKKDLLCVSCRAEADAATAQPGPPPRVRVRRKFTKKRR